jgi:hypothetical protein
MRLDRECPSGELFEPKSSVCLINFAVDCGSRRISSSNDGEIRNVFFVTKKFSTLNYQFVSRFAETKAMEFELQIPETVSAILSVLKVRERKKNAGMVNCLRVI